MGDHLIDGKFKSDKYEWSPPGFVPLKLTDPMAQGLLWEYAQHRRAVDAEFSADLEKALLIAGYKPGADARLTTIEARQEVLADTLRTFLLPPDGLRQFDQDWETARA